MIIKVIPTDLNDPSWVEYYSFKQGSVTVTTRKPEHKTGDPEPSNEPWDIVITVTDQDGTHEYVIPGFFEPMIYLLNDDGKTIDRVAY